MGYHFNCMIELRVFLLIELLQPTLTGLGYPCIQPYYKIPIESFVADTQLYKRFCPSISQLFCWLVGNAQVGSVLDAFWVRVYGGGRRVGRGVLMGVGCFCPPVGNDIVTLLHLFFTLSFFKMDQ